MSPMAQSQKTMRVLTQAEDAPRRRRISYSERQGSEEITVSYLDEYEGYAGFVFRFDQPEGSEKRARATQVYATWQEARREAVALAAS